MGKAEDDAKALADYARVGRPMLDPWPHGHVTGATVTPLKPKAEPSLRDEILEMLAELTDDIKAGRVEPSHLIMGWAEETTVSGQQASSFVWDCAGLNRFEAMGHLHAYACKLANGEGD